MNVTPAGATPPRLRDEWLAYWKDDAPRFLHIVKVGLAVVLSMGLCMRLELRSPATAMLSCVIVMMHQQSGIVIARGFYRGLGMVGGSLAGLVLIALFAQQPLPFFVALAAWIGLCSFGSAYFRNFQSYGLVLTGFATAITAMPAISNPYGVFDNVVYTISEVVIGVVCASVVSSIVLPRNVAPALYAASRVSFTHLLGALRTTLERAPATPRTPPPTAPQAGALLGLIGERANVELLRTGALFEDPSMRLLHSVFLDLDRSFLDTVTWLYALQRLKAHAIVDAHPRAQAAIATLTDATLALMPAQAGAPGVADDAVAALLPQLDAFEAALPAQLDAQLQALADLPPAQRRVVASTGAALLFMTADLRLLCRRYIEARNADRLPWTVSVLQAIGRIAGIARQHAVANRTAALVAGARAALAVLLVGAVWVASGWVGGATAIVAVAITSTLFALVPDPPTAAWQIFMGCLAGWLTGFGFSFFALPHLGTFTLLAAATAIVVMVGAYLNTFPKTAVLGLGFNIYFCFIVGISNPAVYNPSAYLDTGFALLCGIATAAVAFSVFAPRAGEWIARRYLVDLRALIASDARDGELDDDLLYAFEQKVRDCIMQIASAPADPRVDREHMIAWAFAVLEAGRAMILMRVDTQQLGDALPAAWADRLQAWLDALAELFDAPAPERARRALTATDQALAALPPGIDLGARTQGDAPADHEALIRCRMQALLHFTELALRDGALALWARPERSA
ncbi:FUSC family protein [Paraburkholderia sp. MMS20-SJTR3]|uniref:FUSC family protein n=1 Tax=Paraburkholderia sejongensis TaxID=2886946 RepID=A0ABS8JT76_9BURK|nr:FUSC family protein [Paraburkholderia sp. MMS20-SJTR3]MCC8392908.1 FUSC family protein [Paraburkholderia sp. MMS20-SJTR3]